MEKKKMLDKLCPFPNKVYLLDLHLKQDINGHKQTVGMFITDRPSGGKSYEYNSESPWHPIETAPKDKKSILVYCPERRNIYVAIWGKIGGFLNADGWNHFGGRGELLDAPTHWQPLPKPPIKK